MRPRSPMQTGLVFLIALGVVALVGGPARAQDEAIQQILEKLVDYQKVVEKIRGEEFEEDVPGAKQSVADFEKFVQKSFEEELPPEWVAGWEKSLTKLRLLSPGYSLEKALGAFVVSQAGAYYDPKTASFYVVRSDMPRQMLETMVVHELHHALQDQLFDLDAMVEKAREHDSNDRESVITFLVEGEATFVMTLHQFEEMGLDPASAGPMLEMSLGRMRKLNPDQLREMQMSQGMGDSEDMKEAMEALEEMPQFIVRSFTDPYVWGAYAVYKVHSAKGWKGVSALFENPPASTEHILHPEKLLEGGDEPVAVKAPDIAAKLGRGWKRSFDDTMGEHGILAMLDEYLFEKGGEPEDPLAGLLNAGGPTPGEKGAAGWGGDRYSLFEREGGWTALAWHTAWDTEKDAAEFFESFQASVQKFYGPGSLRSPSEEVFLNTVGADWQTETVAVSLDGKYVAILIAPAFVPALEAVEAILDQR